jgi:mannose-1-phosphate guanylyltransferase
MGSDADWIDAGTPATYLAVNLAYAAREDSWLPASVHLDSLARVRDTVMGPGVTVAAGADVKGSLLLERAVVAPDAVVLDSIVGPFATVGKSARIEGLTVLGARAVVEPGSALSGARVSEVDR